ncbi:hypothetical protein MB02_06105 [Croceicoccus estronivorus]|uniref:hypothetical protein n=1 Tax=Croceicoccus estronivorus TaxID=1172626 RepID=UPI00082ED2CC|nr:hypothetical protein [Croceicoccus estronivorus]OCC25007.1 hypothetical protein MB02_06105 [Croceicoccus estronivorus]
MRRKSLAPVITPVLLLLAACGGQTSNAVEKFSLDDIAPHVSHIIATSPDTKGAVWEAMDGARSLRFGKPGAPPFLTLKCELTENAAPKMRIVRLTPADPGAKALFALIGRKQITRINADAHAVGGDWRWESLVPAEDPALDVFLDGGPIEATLPGGGSLNLAASGEPARLVSWCRRHGTDLPE